MSLIEIRKARGQVLPQAFEHSAHVLVKSRLDDLGGPLVFLLESLPALRNLVAQCGDFARDLVERAGAAVDAAEITLEFDRQRRHQKLGSVRPRLMQNVVGRVKHSAEQIQLLAQNLEGQPMRLIVPSNEIDHGDIALLAVPMAAPDALLDALRIPRQIVVDNGLAELQVQPFCAGLRANKDLRTRAELVHESKPHSNFAARLDSWWKPRAFLLFPARERLLRTLVIVDAAEQGDVFVAEADVEKQLPQVFLRSDRLGEHDGLAAAASVPPKIENHLDSFLEGARLGIVRKRSRAGDETLDADQLGSEGCIDRSAELVPRKIPRFRPRPQGPETRSITVSSEPEPACRRRRRAATFSRLAARASIDEAMRRWNPISRSRRCRPANAYRDGSRRYSVTSS